MRVRSIERRLKLQALEQNESETSFNWLDIVRLSLAWADTLHQYFLHLARKNEQRNPRSGKQSTELEKSLIALGTTPIRNHSQRNSRFTVSSKTIDFSNGNG